MSNPLDMNHSCEVCGQRFEPEPGFYYGAMFISYIFSGWFFIGVALLLVFAAGWSIEAAMGVVAALAALLFFKLLRISRSLWIHMMVKYNPSYINKKSANESKNT
ncbi:DUF983 domain-containing protein [Portibacter lacus]|uniref:DUF983 domain-containing protein n=1 Tax=Portibacter lacus TaxID=1099794 RepID=A0AA37SM75_9BACT|nr:DUF983 domain-containing protein [Portibacter lacus]GLR15654.1 hypothetical protein GCM10007940_02690 [Portibacter lacus]